MAYNVAVYDTLPLFNLGVKSVIDNLENYNLQSFFTDFEDFIDYLKNVKKQIDIAIISDTNKIKSFPDAIRFIHENFPEIKIIVLSEKLGEFDIFSTIKSGASAYLYKPGVDPQILKEALDTVLKGEDYFNEPVSNIIIQSYVKKAKKGDEISQRNPKNLTRREVQILQLICEGLTNKQIADGLFISVRTVDAHKNHIMQKLGLRSTAQLVKFAIKHGYVKL